MLRSNISRIKIFVLTRKSLKGLPQVVWSESLWANICSSNRAKDEFRAKMDDFGHLRVTFFILSSLKTLNSMEEDQARLARMTRNCFRFSIKNQLMATIFNHCCCWRKLETLLVTGSEERQTNSLVLGEVSKTSLGELINRSETNDEITPAPCAGRAHA